jgi:type VI secretion system protein ImpK
MNNPKGQTLVDICSDLLLMGSYLRQMGDPEPSDELFDRLIRLFNAMEGKAREAKVASADIEDAKHALVAFIDETIVWASQLEQHFFRSNIAGEEFFDKLDQIRESESRNDVLAVYYLCLTLGFEGRYVRSPAILQEYITEIQREIGLKEVDKLSPNGERPQEQVLEEKRGGIPPWVLWTCVAVAGVAVIVMFIVLKVRITNWASGVVNRIQGLLG